MVPNCQQTRNPGLKPAKATVLMENRLNNLDYSGQAGWPRGNPGAVSRISPVCREVRQRAILRRCKTFLFEFR
jgi:hypothetical protein